MYVCKGSPITRVSYGWHCVCDEMSADDYNANKKCDDIKLLNSYDMLQHESSNEYDKALASVNPNCDVAQRNNNVLNITPKGLRIVTWAFQCLYSDRK